MSCWCGLHCLHVKVGAYVCMLGLCTTGPPVCLPILDQVVPHPAVFSSPVCGHPISL